MPRPGTRKCLNCQTFFAPEPRSKGRQRYCSAPACRKASKLASQKKWLEKPQNQNYFRGPENVLRVQQWRAKNPGYAKKPRFRPGSETPLQDTLTAQPIEIQGKKNDLRQEALQELLVAQPIVLIGLIAHLTGSALQDDIVTTGRKLRQLGEDCLTPPNPEEGRRHVIQNHVHPVSSCTAQDQPPCGQAPPGTNT